MISPGVQGTISPGGDREILPDYNRMSSSALSSLPNFVRDMVNSRAPVCFGNGEYQRAIIEEHINRTDREIDRKDPGETMYDRTAWWKKSRLEQKNVP